jgi:hypothetical protein
VPVPHSGHIGRLRPPSTAWSSMGCVIVYLRNPHAAVAAWLL